MQLKASIVNYYVLDSSPEQIPVVDGGVVKGIVGTVEKVGFTVVLIFIAFNDGGYRSIIQLSKYCVGFILTLW